MIHQFYREGSGKYVQVWDEDKHIMKHYKILAETTDESGIVTIQLAPVTDMEIQIKETAKELASKLRESTPDLTEQIIEDALRNRFTAEIRHIHKLAKQPEQPVSVKKGCLELIVGKGKSHYNRIILRQ